LEAQVKLLSDHAGLPCPAFPGSAASSDAPVDAVVSGTAGQVPEEVAELARAGKTTQAISTYRRLTGASLLEAKTIVEGL